MIIRSKGLWAQAIVFAALASAVATGCDVSNTDPKSFPASFDEMSTLEGRLERLAIEGTSDHFEAGTSDPYTITHLITESGERVVVSVDAEISEVQSGHVRVSGFWDGNVFVVEELEPVLPTVDQIGSVKLALSADETTRKTLLLAVKYEGTADPYPLTNTSPECVRFNFGCETAPGRAAATLKKYWEEVSLGKVKLTGLSGAEPDVKGFFTVGRPPSRDCFAFYGDWAAKVDAAAAARGINVGSYQEIVYLMPAPQGDFDCAPGFAGIGGDRAFIFHPMTDDWTTHAIIHEVGHNLGLHHSGMRACQDVCILMRLRRVTSSRTIRSKRTLRFRPGRPSPIVAVLASTWSRPLRAAPRSESPILVLRRRRRVRRTSPIALLKTETARLVERSRSPMAPTASLLTRP